MSKLYIDEEGRTSVFEILEDEVAIGRGPSSHIQLRDARASKSHGVVRRVRGRWKYVDLESRNGTRVNGRFRNQHWLQHGDTVTVGKAVLRFDLEDAPVSPEAAVPSIPAAVRAPPAPAPARAAVPVPPRPAAPPPTPAAPSVPLVVAAAPAAAAPEPPRALPPAPRVAAPSRRHEDVDETGRPVRKRGMDPAVLTTLLVLGAVAFTVLMFALMSSSFSDNKEVLVAAAEIARRGDLEGAIRHVERNGNPGGADWDRLEEELASWRRMLGSREAGRKDGEAFTWLHQNVTRFTTTTTTRPKTRLSEDVIAAKLKEFLAAFAGTEPALMILATDPDDGQIVEPYHTFRRILRENASTSANVGDLLAMAEVAAEGHAARGHYGEAVRVYEDLKQAQRLLLAGDLLQDLRRRADARVAALREAGGRYFDRRIEEIRSLAAGGDGSAARAKLEVLRDTIGLPNLRREAEMELDRIR